MYLIPAYWVSICLVLAGWAWIYFARSQAGRFQSHILAWLCLPFFAVAIVYFWFGFADVSIETRAAFARICFLLTTLPQTIVLMFISFMRRGVYGQPK